MRTLVSTVFLDSQKMLEKYFFDDLNEIDIKKYLFLESRNKESYKPDYIFKNVIDAFIQTNDINLILFDVLEELSSMLTFKNEKVYIKNKYFEKWQNIILTVSPLFIISYSIYKKSKENKENININIKNIFRRTAIPSIEELEMSEILDNGLNEMHMHLNGATEIDFVWLDALRQSQKFYVYCKKSFGIKDVSEQYL